MGASKHIVRNQDSFVDFHHYPVDSQTIVLDNGSEEDVLGYGLIRLYFVEEIHYLSMMLFMHLGCIFVFYLKFL